MIEYEVTYSFPVRQDGETMIDYVTSNFQRFGRVKNPYEFFERKLRDHFGLQDIKVNNIEVKNMVVKW